MAYGFKERKKTFGRAKGHQLCTIIRDQGIITPTIS